MYMQGGLWQQFRWHIGRNIYEAPNPFVIHTPTATVTDIGTEFGVEVTPGRQTNIHVIQGEVEAVAASVAGGRAAQLIRLKQGHAIKIGHAVREFTAIPCEAQHFARSVRPSPESDEFGVPALKGLWRWDCPNVKDGYSLVDRPGWLRISLASGSEDSWNTIPGRGKTPFLCTSLANYPARFSVETFVDGGSANAGSVPKGSHSGFVVHCRKLYFDTAPFQFVFGLYRDAGSTMIQVDVCGRKACLSDEVGWASANLRMDRDDAAHTWTMYYRHEADDPWIRLGVVNDDDLPDVGLARSNGMMIGLAAKTFGWNVPNAQVDFDYYRVTPLAEAADAIRERP
jgi:hypothetical protein